MALLGEILSHKIRFLKSSVLAFSFLILGLGLSVTGPTLLDLRQAVNAHSSQISIIFPVGSMGYLLGSIAGGLVYDRFDSQLTMAAFCAVMSISGAFIPWNRTVTGLAITLFIMGLGGGGLDAAGNVWLLHMWGKSSPPFMQALHFTFGLGAFISPLIAEPFLSKTVNFTDTGEEAEVIVGKTEDMMFWYPYAIISGLGIITVISLVVMYFVKSSDKPHPSIQDRHTLEQLPFKQKCIILFFASVIFHSYCGLEIAFGRFVTTFAYYSDLHLNKSIGAYMTSTFWGTFTLFRLLPVFIVDFIGNKTMIFTDLIIVFIGNTLLLLFANSSETGLWVGVALMGAGTASIFPTMFSFVEELMPVTSRIGSLFLVVSCLGEFTIPFIVGYYVEKYPLSLVYVTTIGSVVCFIFFILLCLISKSIKKSFDQKLKAIEENHKIIE